MTRDDVIRWAREVTRHTEILEREILARSKP